MNPLPESPVAASDEAGTTTDSILSHVFPGESEMARRMRAFDWAATPLGPVDRWPENLHIATGIFLALAEPHGSRSPDDLERRVAERTDELTRLIDALRSSEEEFRAFFELASVGAVQIDAATGKFLRTNRRFGEMLGYTASELRDMGFADLLHPTDRSSGLRHLEDVQQVGAREFVFEKRLLRKEGVAIWANVSGAIARQENERAVRIVAVVQDTTDRRAAEAAQRRSETQYRTLAELVPDLLWQCNGRGTSHWYNRRWFEYTGQFAANAIEAGWLEPIHPKDRPSAAAGFQQARRNGERFRQECRLRRGLDGEYRWFLLQMVPVRDESGAIAQWFGAATDTHEQRAALNVLQATEERVRLAVDAADMGFWDWDIERGTVQWEARHNRMLGLPADQQEGSYDQFIERVHPEDRAALEAAVQQALRRGEPYAAEFRAVWPDGTVRWIAGRGRVFRDLGRSTRMIGAVLDITERKEVERELQEKQKRLEEALDTAEAAGNAKDEFLATLSHELRTPLSPVLMVATEAASDTALSEEVRSTFQIVRKNVELEARLIDDLLDLTRITRGKMSLDRSIVDLHSVLRDAVETILPDLRSKQIELSTAFHARVADVEVDPVRLQQIFWNILRNAVKFTPQHGRIAIVSENAPSAERILVRITDSGMGMTPEELGRIFDAFAQGEHAVHRPGMHQFGGLGLGLAISQRLAEMQGGQIRAESEGRGQGATFIVDLPTALPAEESVSTTPFVDQPLSLQPPASLCILLVEDHDSTRHALAKLLERRQHRVATASLGEEAIKLVSVASFDVVISDLGLPDMDGCSLLLKLREAQPGLPGIALSGWGMEEDVRRSREAGFTEHLVKPVAVHKLEAAINRVLVVRHV